MITSKCALLICYYGKWPEHFHLWLESVRRNGEFDFIIVSDIPTEKFQIPGNVIVIKESFEQLKERFQSCFDFKISLEKYYKLCDYRAVYGLAFREELSGYDFWGFCDIDLIFGDLSKFITQKILDENKKIFEYGHFTLLKNDEKMRYLFREKGANFSYKEVFSHPENYAFDEMFGLNKIIDKNNIEVYRKELCKDIAYTMDGILSISPDIYEEIYYWEDGCIFGAQVLNGQVKRKEYMYLHFQKKNIPNTIENNRIPHSYYISMNGFRERKNNGFPTCEEIIKNTDFTSQEDKKRARCAYKKENIKNKFVLASFAEKRIYVINSLSVLKNRLKR